MNGPLAILLSLGSISVFGWMYILALTFSIQGDPARLFSPDNETAGTVRGRPRWQETCLRNHLSELPS